MFQDYDQNVKQFKPCDQARTRELTFLFKTPGLHIILNSVAFTSKEMKKHHKTLI